MVNQTVIKSTVEFNRHEKDAVDFNKKKYGVENTSTVLRLGLYALKYMDKFAPDVEQFKSDLRHFLKNEKIYLRKDVVRCLKI